MQNQNKIYDVIIAGAGPVGLFLACELRLGGIDVLVLESSNGGVSPLKPAPLGMRGLTIGTVEAFYRRNLLESLRSEVSEKSTAQDKRGGHFAGIEIDFTKVDRSLWHNVLPGPAAAPMGATIEQIENVLKKKAEKLGVVIRYNCALEDVRQAEEVVRAVTKVQTFEARWLVGCDGGRSQVRRTAGFEFVGTEAEFTAYAALVKINDPEKLRPGRNLTSHGFYMQPIPGFISVMEFDGGQFDRANGITLEHFQDVLRRVSVTDVTVSELQYATSYTDRAKRVTSFQKGRVLLAGDAAHIHSPLGGQGLNLGIGDAMNLGWKLASVINHPERAHMLETYFSERSPVADRVLDWSRAQVQLMKPDAYSQALRKLMTHLIETKDGATYFAENLLSSHLRYNLDSDRQIIGMSLPDFTLSDGTRIGHHFEGGKGLFVSFQPGSDGDLIAKVDVSRIKVVHSNNGNDFGISAILARPDGVVCWLHDQDGQSENLNAVLKKWFGV